MAGEKPIAENRKARFDYQFLERHEAGVVLTGSEVKSLREGHVSLAQAYADVRNGEAWLVGVHIDPYDQAGDRNHEPERDRKLLLHRRELDSLYGKVREKGLTLVPLRLYFKDGRAKVELALAAARSSGTSGATSRSGMPTARSSASSSRGAEPRQGGRQLGHLSITAWHLPGRRRSRSP